MKELKAAIQAHKEGRAPSVAKMGFNYIQHSANKYSNKLIGIKTEVDEIEYKRRMDICYACSEGTLEKNGRYRCPYCGCNMALKNKDANICDDLPSAGLENVGGFKMAVGDGWISGEYKFGDKMRFKNTAKDTNVCNKIPVPKKDIDDDAYYDRILLIPMDNVVSEEKRDKNLIDKLTTEEELSGLLNWAIEGWKRLCKNNKFSDNKTSDEIKFIMQCEGVDSLGKFVIDVLEQGDGLTIDKEDMYNKYCDWCFNHKPKLSPHSKDKLGKRLIKFAPFIRSESTGKKRYWLNVKFKGEIELNKGEKQLQVLQVKEKLI